MADTGTENGSGENGVNGIIEFLNVQVDEDERQAQQELRFLDAAIIRDQRDKRRRIDPDSGQRTISPWVQREIDRANRMLREIAAKRAIMTEHESVILHAGHPLVEPSPGAWRRVCRSCAPPTGLTTHAWPCLTLRHLAGVYADHPDCREEWRP